jgi:allophanate hydrolase
MMLQNAAFTLSNLREIYRKGLATPEQVALESLRRASCSAHPNVWITLLDEAQILGFVRQLDQAHFDTLPLFGIPFAIKDNIDLADVVTSVGCPAFAFKPDASATVVSRLIAAGAIPIGKTNMDQFATGLVGTRSPYGACASVFNPHYISGGSSSGSAVAVASGMVAFALGTDTAGSGRVPAAFNQIVGLKPSPGAISTTGVFPACRSLDCVSIFAGSCFDADIVLEAAVARDLEDPYSREIPPKPLPQAPKIGVPAAEDCEFFGDLAAATLFEEAKKRVSELGGQLVEIDFAPFRETAALLYQGPWVAERRHAVGPFLETNGAAMDATVHSIISGGERFSAVECFAATYKLKALASRTQLEWAKMDALLLPTTATIYTHKEVADSPLALNSSLGFYTNFVNLLDLAAVAIPAGNRAGGLPFGVTFIAPSGHDRALLALSDRMHKATGGSLGVTEAIISEQPEVPPVAVESVLLAVVGAHLTGQPLNWQLTSRGAQLVKTCRTADCYRLFALANTMPPKPGLVRETNAASNGIELEIWSLTPQAFGSFVAEVPPPMVIGSVVLSDGSTVKGFLCESVALEGAMDITQFGGWRAYREATFNAQATSL